MAAPTPRQKHLYTHNGKTFATTFTATAAGSLLVAMVTNVTATAGHGFAPTTPAGWTLGATARSPTTVNEACLLYYIVGTAGGKTSVTWTGAGSTGQYWTVVIAEYTGFSTLVGKASNNVTATSIALTSSSVATNTGLVLAMVGTGNSGTVTMTCSGYTLVTAETNGNTWITSSLWAKTQTATGTQTATIAGFASATAVGYIAVFKKKSGGTNATAHPTVANVTVAADNAAVAASHLIGKANVTVAAHNAAVGLSGAATPATANVTVAAHSPSVSVATNATAHPASANVTVGATGAKPALTPTAAKANVTVGAHNPAVTTGGGTTVSYTLQSGYPTKNVTSSTQTITTHAVGNMVLAVVHLEPSSGTSHVSSMSDTNSRITWQTSASVIGQQATLSNNRMEIWYGTVKSVGTTKVETHWVGTTFDEFIYTWEWASPFGSTSSWFLVNGGHISTVASGTVMHFPTLESGTKGGLYCGWIYTSTVTGTVGSAGTTPGFTYGTDFFDNVLTWNHDLGALTHYRPNAGQTPPNENFNGIAIVMAATGTSGVTALPAAANVTVGAFNPAKAIGPTGGSAGVVVAAHNAALSTTGTAGAANVTVAAHAPSISIGGGGRTVTAGSANVSVAAHAPASFSPTVTPSAASVSVVAFNPLIIFGTVATPQVANVSVSANAPALAIRPLGRPANVVVVALSPSVDAGVLPVTTKLFIFEPPEVADTPPFLRESAPEQKRLWRHYKNRKRGVDVFLLNNGQFVQTTATPTPTQMTNFAGHTIMGPQPDWTPSTALTTVNVPYPWNPYTPTAPYSTVQNWTGSVTTTTLTPRIMRVFYGGHENIVDEATAAALIEAGYGDCIRPVTT